MKRLVSQNPQLVVFMLGIWIFLLGFAADKISGSEKPLSKDSLIARRMTQKITYSCINLPIDLVLLQLTEEVGIDIIKSPEVQGPVTVKFTNVPFKEAFENILATYGWGYIQTENMIRVVPIAQIIQKEEKEREKEKYVEKLITERLVTKTYRITYADVKEVAQALQKFVSKKGSVALIQGTSNIMITETEDRIEAIDDFMQEIDRMTPQILVEVRIYDITHQDRLDLGIDWAAGRNTVFDAAGNPTGGRLNPFLVAGFSGGDSSNENVQASIRFGILNDAFNLDALIRAQEEVINAELLANPRLLVVDNVSATFQAIREIPYTEESQTAMGGAMTSTKFKEVGVTLRVTPHVTRKGMVRMHVAPEFGIVVGQAADGPPTVDTRKTDTVTLVKDGQTIVLGGLRKKETRQTTRKIPLLGDIPLLGLLFRSKGEEVINSELVVFITPKIVTEQIAAGTVLTESETGYLKRTGRTLELGHELLSASDLLATPEEKLRPKEQDKPEPPEPPTEPEQPKPKVYTPADAIKKLQEGFVPKL